MPDQANYNNIHTIYVSHVIQYKALKTMGLFIFLGFLTANSKLMLLIKTMQINMQINLLQLLNYL